MRLTIIGTGYVGLVTGACFADTGNEVIGYDRDADKIERLRRGECPIFEPGLPDLIKANMNSKRLRFSTDPVESIHHAEVIIIAVGTPPKEDGSPDLSAIRAVGRDIAQHLNQPKIVIIKSTVPVGTGDELEELINGLSKHKVSLVSTPEFLKEGSAVADFQKPDRIVIGAEDSEAAARIKELHEPLVRNQRPILLMRRRAAEMTKYTANAFLALKISFINQIANICEKLGIDVNEVRSGIGTDARIGFQFLHPGVGYGGSCFPKDVQALAHVARKAGVQADLIEQVHEINQRQRELLFNRIVERFNGDLKGRTLAFWGISFKPKTDDIREAPAVTLIERALAAGAKARAHDPEALDSLKAQFGDKVSYHESCYDVLDGADALIISTEWNEFRSPNFDEIRERLKYPIVFDGRNLYAPESMQTRQFEYYSIGRPFLPPDQIASV